MNIAVGVRISSLKGKHVSIRRCIQLYDRFHWQRPIYEVRWLVVNVLHVDNDTLIVRVCNRRSIIDTGLQRQATIDRKRWTVFKGGDRTPFDIILSDALTFGLLNPTRAFE